ncbi:hypothetical protein BDV12DRAFT_171491 [Aspergillus spectabilis]
MTTVPHRKILQSTNLAPQKETRDTGRHHVPLVPLLSDTTSIAPACPPPHLSTSLSGRSLFNRPVPRNRRSRGFFRKFHRMMRPLSSLRLSWKLLDARVSLLSLALEVHLLSDWRWLVDSFVFMCIGRLFWWFMSYPFAGVVMDLL